MKLREAIALLDAAPTGEEPSAVNRGLTKTVSVRIVRNAVATMGQPKDNPCGMEDDIDPLMELRVHQVHRNQKRPRY